MPVGNILVGDTRCNIEHDDAALSLNVVSITETTELFLTSSVPDVETDCSEVGKELKRMDFHPKSSYEDALCKKIALLARSRHGGFHIVTLTSQDREEWKGKTRTNVLLLELSSQVALK